MPGTGYPTAAAAYCRDARRLRGALANQPARMHRKLRELAARQDRSRPQTEPATQTSRILSAGMIPPRARAFADEVAASLDGTVLRYSQRRALVRSARGLGIGEFEANLVIAAVQHERRRAEAETPSASAAAAAAAQPRRRIILAPLFVVLAVESLLAVGVWRVCFAP